MVWASLVMGAIVAPLRLRRRLPRSWLRGSAAERFIYGATSFFPLAMIGFAVTSFFVSFAWMDPVYLMAALLTGLYVAARAQFEGVTPDSGDHSSQIALSGVAGWRVRQSEWRASITAKATRSTR